MLQRKTAGGIPADFPRDVLPLFNTFGRFLRDDESVELASPTGTSSPIYDRQVRKHLILLRDTTYEDKADITGRVVQFDSERKSFQLAVEGGRRISGILTEPSLPLIRFAVGQDDLLVRVVGGGLFNAHDELVRFQDIEEVSLSEDEDRVKELDIEARIQTLAELEDGWLDGRGTALNRHRLIRFSRVLKSAVENEGLSRPYLYPTPEGGIQAEWSFADAEVSAEIDHIGAKGLLSGGVWAVTVGEGHNLDLKTYGDPVVDPVPDPAHAVIDFSQRPGRQMKRDAQLLARDAHARGCLYAES